MSSIEEDELMMDITDPLRGCKGIFNGIVITVALGLSCLVGYFVILALTGNLG